MLCALTYQCFEDQKIVIQYDIVIFCVKKFNLFPQANNVTISIYYRNILAEIDFIVQKCEKYYSIIICLYSDFEIFSYSSTRLETLNA